MLLRNFLKEDVRPTLYRGMKYWGKKPHNIWSSIIDQYSSVGDIIYDPFAGSGLTFFESIKISRKPVVCDINPLTLFLVNLYSKDFNLTKIKSLSMKLISDIKNTHLYKKNYTCKCSYCGNLVDVYNFRWIDGCPKELSYKCSICKKSETKKNNLNFYDEDIKIWKPSFDLKSLSSTNEAFFKKIGGYDVSNLWTKRNFNIISLIFNEIIKIKSLEKDALMFAFLQMVHLTTKMCALRGKEANRHFSTSWGRPAFLGLSRYMEQNPVLQFERAINGNSGVVNCIISRQKYLPKYTYSTSLKDIDKVDGVVLLGDSKTVFGGFRANLVITDPPYGSIIQYGELSQVWNVWLNKYDKKFKTSLEDEIVVNKSKPYLRYISDMSVVLDNCHNILDNNKSLVMTYNSNKEEDWVYLNKVIKRSSFFIKEKKIQRNKRASEANVKSKNGMAITDYYLSLSSKLDLMGVGNG